MTDAVVIVLREVLEAMLVCVVLMAASQAARVRHVWLLVVSLVSAVLAYLYAANLTALTLMFDGRGQEFVNIVLLVTASASLFFYMSRIPGMLNEKADKFPVSLYLAMIAGASAALTRELAEIFVYVFAYGVVAGQSVAVISGAAIGAGVGVSIGIFMYYALLWVGRVRCLQVSAIVMGLVSAGLLSQAARFMVQSGLLAGEHVLWDSSWLLTETSLTGELLHALIGYDATPSAEQLIAYGASLLFTVLVLRRVFDGHRANGDLQR